MSKKLLKVLSDFDPAEYSDRYNFEKGLVVSKATGQPLTPQIQINPQGRQYSHYCLIDNSGTRRKVSTLLMSGRVSLEGDLYQITHWPKGWEARAGFPAYLFHPGKKEVRRVGFRVPRADPVTLKPNKIGQYKLLTPDGYKWYDRDVLFR
jgi:hypothetical protein